MGLAAGQARLLSITARLSDNEQTGQALSFAKQRLADETDQINQAYNEALSSTKLTVLTGFNGTEAQYEDISYGLMTGYNTVAAGKQYVVTDAKGKILVTDELAAAYKKGNGNFNVFLENVNDMSSGQKVNYSQCDLDFSNGRRTEENIKAVHEAWDKYMTSVGKRFEDLEHNNADPDVSFGFKTGTYVVFENGRFVSKTAEPYPYVQLNGGNKYALNYEGTTQEQRELYDYAYALTKEVYTSDSGLKTISDDPEVASKIQYYRNIFNQMATFGYTTAAEMDIPVNHLNEGLIETTLLKDNNWFEQFLRQGKIQLKAFDSTQRDFIVTTFDQDSSIQEVEDERKIAKAEADFVQAQNVIERKDKKIDLELKKLDTEHNALQTEYESIKSVVDKNVEKSFNMFS